ncbi:translation factor GTPase family protein [Saccharopolyspora sp. NPDC050642]|uniref:translation factor GTPase family protein n=1 Tax=Saccharopolyspora sp. NPDC050642 TaxID=3157099 RepID=UPI0033C02063
MHTLNLGILAHIDAGKTSLTERLLHSAGVIDEIGSVDDGSTQTDSLALERQRGITIKSAVVSFVVDDIAVNLIDTPGHPDFIAEVERVLGVLDGAVLVVSAVEGVQAQTRILLRTLRRLGIPTLIFANKIDRRGATYDQVLQGISAKLTPATVPMGRLRDPGTPGAEFAPFDGADAEFTARSTEVLADHDDDFLAEWLDAGTALPYPRIRRELAAQTKRALVHPVYFGSAATGAGVGPLIAGVRELLPTADGAADGPLSGTVFKVERGPAGEKLAYVRMFSGTLNTRDRLRFRGGDAAKVTAINVFDRGGAARRASVAAGEIGVLRGLADVRIGDAVGEPRAGTNHRFAPPTLETVIFPRRRADLGALHLALTQLAEQDPLIDLRQDDVRQEISVSLYGEVQKEVIQSTLADEYGIDVGFRETTTICIERPTGAGTAVEMIGKGGNPFLAGIGLRVQPHPGVDFRLEIELGSLPSAFIKAVEESARETLLQGIHGWQVTDCLVAMTYSHYLARQSHSHGTFDKSMSSTAGDFRNLTPLVLMSALQDGGTEVSEPLHQFHLELPADALGTVLPVLARLRAAPGTTTMRGSSCLLEGEIPAARVYELQQQLPGLTRGEGVLDSAFDRYEPVRGEIPTRPRTDRNPLDRKEYLLRLRVAGR